MSEIKYKKNLLLFIITLVPLVLLIFLPIENPGGFTRLLPDNMFFQIGWVLWMSAIAAIIGAVLVGFFLGPLFETKIRQSLLISGGSFSIFFTRPIALAFFLLTIFGVIFLISRKRKINQRT